MTSYKFGPYTAVNCSIEPNMIVKIDEAFGNPLGGKSRTVLEVFFKAGCEGAFMMRITGYEHLISVNWVKEIKHYPKRQLEL